MLYSSRWVHHISPKPDDNGPDVELVGSDTSDSKSLARKLRAAKILQPGESCRFRVEGERIIVFPRGTRFSHIVWSHILTPKV